MPWQLTLTYRGPANARLDSGPLHHLGCSLLDDHPHGLNTESPHKSKQPKQWSIHAQYPQPGTARIHLSLFNDALQERLRTRILDQRRYQTPSAKWILDLDACDPPAEHPWTQLAIGDPTVTMWTVTFHPPGASYISGGFSTVDFGPDRVLRRLTERWQHHHPTSCPATTPRDLPTLRVLDITGKTTGIGRDRVRAWGENSLWQGRYTYATVPDTTRPERNPIADALFAFAELHGIGSRVEFGRGAVSITRTTSPPRGHRP